MGEKKRVNRDIPPSLRISTLEAAIEDGVSLEMRCTCSKQLCLLKTNNGEVNYELSTVIRSLTCVLNGPSSRFPRYDYTCTILVTFAVHSLVTSKKKTVSTMPHRDPQARARDRHHHHHHRHQPSTSRSALDTGIGILAEGSMHVHVKVHDVEQFWRGKYHFLKMPKRVKSRQARYK